MSAEIGTRKSAPESVLTCHACGENPSELRGAAGRLCDPCWERWRRIFERLLHNAK